MGSEIKVIIKENETMKIGHSSHDWYKGYNWKTLTNDGQCNKRYDWWEVKYNIIIERLPLKRKVIIERLSKKGSAINVMTGGSEI